MGRAWKGVNRVRKKIRQCIANADGSSIVSVLMAFVLLLLGIGAFSAAVNTAGDLVRRANMLNAATGEVLERFYPEYAKELTGTANYVTDVKRVIDSETDTVDSEVAFKLHTKLYERVYDLTQTNESGEPVGDSIEYKVYYYKYHYE